MPRVYANGADGPANTQFRIHAFVNTPKSSINTYADCAMQSFDFRLKDDGAKFVRDMEFKSGKALCIFARGELPPQVVHLTPGDPLFKEAIAYSWTEFRTAMDVVDKAFMQDTVIGRVILNGRLMRYENEIRFLIAHEIAARYGHYIQVYTEHNNCAQAVLQEAASLAHDYLKEGLSGAIFDVCNAGEEKVDVHLCDAANIPAHAKIALRRALAHKEINIFANLKNLSKAERRTLHQKVESRIECGQTFYSNDELLQWIEDAHAATLASRAQSKKDRERFKNVRIGANY